MAGGFSFTDQINLLFEQRSRSDGHAYSLQEVAEATGISVPTLSQMRTGQNTNPRLSTLKSLAQFFRVNLGYFEGASYDECMAILHSETTASPPVSEIALRAAHLSPEAQRDLVRMISWLVAADRHRGDSLTLPAEFEPYSDD